MELQSCNGHPKRRGSPGHPSIFGAKKKHLVPYGPERKIPHQPILGAVHTAGRPAHHRGHLIRACIVTTASSRHNGMPHITHHILARAHNVRMSRVTPMHGTLVGGAHECTPQESLRNAQPPRSLAARPMNSPLSPRAATRGCTHAHTKSLPSF